MLVEYLKNACHVDMLIFREPIPFRAFPLPSTTNGRNCGIALSVRAATNQNINIAGKTTVRAPLEQTVKLKKMKQLAKASWETWLRNLPMLACFQKERK